VKYSGDREEVKPRPPIFMKPSLAGVLSLLFLVAVGVLWLRKSREEPAEAVTRPFLESQENRCPGRFYTVQDGDTLEALARRFYRDPRQWSTLARVNDIRDPRKLRAGRVIWVPDVESR